MSRKTLSIPLATRRFFWRWRGECVLFCLWLLRPILSINPLRRFYLSILAAIVRKTELFDIGHYREANPDVVDSKFSPLLHYVGWGDHEGRWPMPLFDPHYYRSHAIGFTRSVNSLLHYAWVGRYRGISPSTWFDLSYYLAQNRDVARSGIDPLVHYLRWGGLEGRSPNPQFDGRHYLNSYPEVQAAGLNPLLHYIHVGRQEGCVTGKHMRYQGDGAGGDSHRALDKPIAGDWSHLEDRVERSVSAHRVDVVIPVYKNHTLTWKCLTSVLTTRNQIPFEIIVIDDCSPEPKISADLAAMAARGLITLLSNERNLGFVATVNRGMSQHPDRDVVLLNSDTEVYQGWLDRLHHAAYSGWDVASVTPLSNNATICSYPRFLHDNPYPLEIDYPRLDRLTAQVNSGVTVEAPTGVGFCMYLRRAALDVVGTFDEAAFGKGYGEENDWCQRAIKEGLRNLIAADVFVRHFGSASFQGEKGKRVANALQILARKHPTYGSQVQHFVTADPLLDARRRLDWARLKLQTRPENILMVCHNRGGGSERHLQEDAERVNNEGKGVFLMRPVKGQPHRVRIRHHACRHIVNLPSFRLADTRELSGVLSKLNIMRIHSHGLIDFEPEAPLHLLRLSRETGAALHVDVHDYKIICPRINLVDEDGHYCGEPDTSACNVCLATRGNSFGVTEIGQWRERHYRVLRASEKIWVPSKDVSQRLNRYYPDLTFTVMPHDEIAIQDIVLQRPQVLPGEKLRIVIIGMIGKMKGLDVVRACARKAQQHNLPLQFIVAGHSIHDHSLINAGVQITGKYQEEDALELLQRLEPHMVFLPSLWPETYSYTLSIALKAGLPVFAFDLGAIAERLRALGLADHLQPISMASHPQQLNKQFMAYRNTNLRKIFKATSSQQDCHV